MFEKLEEVFLVFDISAETSKKIMDRLKNEIRSNILNTTNELIVSMITMPCNASKCYGSGKWMS